VTRVERTRYSGVRAERVTRMFVRRLAGWRWIGSVVLTGLTTATVRDIGLTDRPSARLMVFSRVAATSVTPSTPPPATASSHRRRCRRRRRRREKNDDEVTSSTVVARARVPFEIQAGVGESDRGSRIRSRTINDRGDEKINETGTLIIRCVHIPERRFRALCPSTRGRVLVQFKGLQPESVGDNHVRRQPLSASTIGPKGLRGGRGLNAGRKIVRILGGVRVDKKCNSCGKKSFTVVNVRITHFRIGLNCNTDGNRLR
jgi:hypothetical protein